MWMKTIQQDLKSNNPSLSEAIDLSRNAPLWRLYIWCYALVVHDRKEEEKEEEEQVQYPKMDCTLRCVIHLC